MRLIALSIIFLLGSAGFSKAQSEGATDSPKLAEHFTFRLDRYQERTQREVVERMSQESEAQHALELHAADQSIFERTIDLLRFVPLKLSSSDLKSDDFLTPNYLRPEYSLPVRDYDLFGPR